MDLGLTGRTAIVCASSRGLGLACARALAEAGCTVIINGRNAEALFRTARELSAATGMTVIPVAGDIGLQSVRTLMLEACPSPDILVNNNSGPAPKDFRKLTHAELIAGVEANMVTPIALTQAVIDGMVERRFGRIINITSGSVKMPLAGLDLSSGARAGLTAFLGGVAREVAHANVTINNILPGAFDTDRLKSAAQKQSELKGMPVAQLQEQRRESIPAKRFGEPSEFGNLCAFIASKHAGYMTGQNFLIDGGAFPGAF